MNLPQINELNAEQEALIPVYLDKWKNIAFSIKSINKELATEAIKSAYTAISLEKPRIIFCDSPFLGIIPLIIEFGSNTPLATQLAKILGNQLGELYEFSHLEDQLFQQLENQINDVLLKYLVNRLSEPLINQLDLLQLENKLLETQESEMERIVSGELLESEKHLLVNILGVESEALINSQRQYEVDKDLLPDTTMWQIDGLSQLCILSNYWAAKANLFDFCKGVLNIEIQPDIWEIYQGIAEHCGFIYSYEKVCIICER